MSRGGYEVAEKCFEYSIVFTSHDCAEMAGMTKKEAIELALKLWQAAGGDANEIRLILNRRRK